MKERGRFLYEDPDGTIFIKFEHPGKGVPIESLLPEDGRGDGFENFQIIDYLDLASLVLVAPKEWAAFCNTVNLNGVTKENPKTVSPPGPNLDFLKLRSANGMDSTRAAKVFTIVTAYWQSNKEMGLEPGLVATLWNSGMTADDIIAHIRRLTDSDGKLMIAGLKDERELQILNTMTEVFKTAKGMEPDTILLQSQMAESLEVWMQATRTAKLDSAELTNSVLLWTDYRRLGLVDAAGGPILANVRTLAAFVFSKEVAPDFEASEIWARVNLANASTTAATASNAAKGLLKKKRKQGKLNRKRGRR